MDLFNKNNIKIGIAVVVVALFIFEIVAIGVLGTNKNIFEKKDETQKVGRADFNGTIRTYEPLLLIPSGASASLTELRALPGVKEVTQEKEGMLITLETRDDVYPAAVMLKNKNITVLGVANIASPSIIPVVFEDGTTANVTTGDVRIQVETEPLVPPDTQVGLAMLVAVSNSRIIQYGSTFIKTEEKNITLEGALQWTMFEYSYSIPWENRTAVDAKALSAEYGKAEYSRKDVGFFKSELAPAQLIELKKLDYVEYIDKKSVVFSENFTDAAKAESEMNTSMSFQPSSLRIVTNSTANLPYPNEAAYIYSIRLNPENYDIPEHLLNVVITSDRQYDYPSATVQVSINGQFIGSTLVTIKEAKITAPSAQ